MGASNPDFYSSHNMSDSGPAFREAAARYRVIAVLFPHVPDETGLKFSFTSFSYLI